MIAVGAVLALAGVALHLGWLDWFGRLPGDVRIENEHTRVYVPITSMLLASVAVSAVVWLFKRAS